MVGKYVQIRDSYLSLHEALMHGGLKTRTRVNIHYVESTDIEQRGTHALKGVDAILVPGGFGERDRKSTRLNSSHLVISYAVFCLKKKNIYHTVLQAPYDVY